MDKNAFRSWRLVLGELGAFVTMPRVDIIMPVYNGERFLREAIDSVIKQTFPCWRLWVIDDASIDASMAIAGAYQDPRIVILRNTDRLGVTATRNRGLEFAVCPYTAILDCDDVWLPEKLALQVRFLEENLHIGVVGSRAEFIDEEGHKLGESKKQHAKINLNPFLLFANCVIHSSVMLRRELFALEGYRRPSAEDYDLWVRCSAKTQIWNLPQILVKYRMHKQSETCRQGIQNRQLQEELVSIYKGQLERLGMGVVMQDILLHASIIEKNCFDRRGLVDVENWLVQLYRANDRIGIYDRDVFYELLIERWLVVCFTSGRRDLWRKALTSIFLQKMHKNGVWVFIKVFLKCSVRVLCKPVNHFVLFGAK